VSLPQQRGLDTMAKRDPIYPALPSVKKYRKPLATLTRDQRRAYGEAVETAIRALQRSELQRELPEHRVNCASGTNHNDGREISKAMRAKHRAALQASVAKDRRDRTPEQWQAMYDAAMAAKREALPLAA
jgi:hypothetical protein